PTHSRPVDSVATLQSGSCQTRRYGAAQAALDRRRHHTKGAVVLLDLFCDDRHARAAHDYRLGNNDGDFDHGVARQVQSRISRAGGNLRTLLALCRYHLDISLPAAVFVGKASGTWRLISDLRLFL